MKLKLISSFYKILCVIWLLANYLFLISVFFFYIWLILVSAHTIQDYFSLYMYWFKRCKKLIISDINPKAIAKITKKNCFQSFFYTF